MLKYLMILCMVLTSCASISGEWGAYKRVGVAQSKEVWHFCRKDLHGPELHGTGVCYPAQECRFRKTILGNEKRECRTKMLVCKWGDVTCLQDHNIFNNVILNKGVQ